MAALLDLLFGCSHRRITFPITRLCACNQKHTYVVCLDCGKEMKYDWRRMRITNEPFHYEDPATVPDGEEVLV